MNQEDIRYPIGKFQPQPFSHSQKELWLTDLAFLPKDVEMVIQNLDEAQLNAPYRQDGWTIVQVIHHLADSHMNGYTRCKLALTEDKPVIKPYNEKLWATMNDVFGEPVNVSITLLHALHRRWVSALQHLDEDTWMTKAVFHPEHNQQMSLWYLLGNYAWHGRHHVAHILHLRQRKNW